MNLIIRNVKEDDRIMGVLDDLDYDWFVTDQPIEEGE